MKDSIGRILVSEQQLLEKIKELGKRITEDYQGRDLLLVSILKGSCIFGTLICRFQSILCMYPATAPARRRPAPPKS